MKRHGLGLTLVILVTFAALFASVWRRGQALDQPLPTKFELEPAAWVGYPGGSDVLYLRKSMVLATVPARAWLRVAAIDAFEVYLNGQRIGREEYIGGWPSGVYDVAGLLRAGRNVVALKAESTTFGTTATLAASLEWIGTLGVEHAIATDSTWRVERRQRFSGLGVHAWFEPDFLDHDWSWSEVVTPGDVTLIPPELPLAAVASDPRGEWIWHADRLATSGSFARPFVLEDAPVREAWISVAASGAVLVAVNGQLLGPVAGSERNMEVFEIASMLRPGTNTLFVHVSGETRPMRVGIRGQVRTDRYTLELSSDDRWRSSPDHAPVVRFGALGPKPPVLVAASVPKPVSMRKRVDTVGLFFVILALLGVVGTAHVWAMGPAVPLLGRWLGFCQPLAVSILLMGALQLVDWDPRFSLGWAYRFLVPAAILLLVGTWLVLLQGRGPLSALVRRRPFA